MSDSYCKLMRSIVASTIVSEPLATRWLWVTLLSQADRTGCVYGSVPGIARMANITLQECEAALNCFYSPDPYSRTQDHEGRRVEVIDGGWRLLNHAKYGATRNSADRTDEKREWDQINRPSGHARKSGRAKASQAKPDSPTVSDAQSDSPTPESSDYRSPTAPTPLDVDVDVDVEVDKSLRAGGRDTREEIIAPSPMGRACRLMKAAGCGAQVNPHHANLIAAIAEGVTPEALGEFARQAVEEKRRSPFAYAIAMARSNHADQATQPRTPIHANASTPKRRLSAVDRVVANITERRANEHPDITFARHDGPSLGSDG